MTYDRELEVAIKAAKEAGDCQMERSGLLATVEVKDDDSPVTEVDKQCEDIIRSRLLGEFPEDGFLGEESGLRFFYQPLLISLHPLPFLSYRR